MQADDPPSLLVGTPVSAKYKGAFCEAKVSKVVRIVKCKVTFKMGLGTATVSDEQIRGALRVGQLVQAKHPEKKDFVDATITKIQDCSQYTVVFDDGDITTLRRTALCLKSGRHFNESETLDQLPLTHPEHFGNPVVGRRGRRSRQLKEDSSEGEAEEENEPDLELYSADIGRVVSIEASDKKRSKDNWFPGLVVTPSAQPTVRINVKDEFLIRSFKDGRYYTVPKKEVSEFNRDQGMKVESSILAEAVEKALKYLDNDELPVHWERSVLFNEQSQYSDSEENFSDSSSDEAFEEKDHFVAQLYKFMDDAGTPLNKSPTINGKDVDLYRLFKSVEKLGGYNRVTNQNKWRTVTARLKFPNNQTLCNQVKSVYKKCLLSYESFNRTLGVTMLSHPRSAKKNRGRSLIRDKDRATPLNSPRPDKDDYEIEKKEEVEEKVVVKPKKAEVKPKEEEKKKKEVVENSDENSSDATDVSETVPKEVGRPKRLFKKAKTVVVDKIEKITKVVVEKMEVPVKKEEKEDDMGQQTRSKTSLLPRNKEVVSPDIKRDLKTPTNEQPSSSKTVVAKPVIKNLEEKKRGRKRINADDKTSHSDSSTTDSSTSPHPVNIGDKLKVYYGPTHESKVTYEAKVIEIDKDSSVPMYLVHYTGWNTRYDEWIQPQRIAENLSAATKAKRLKQNVASASKAAAPKPAAKRGRGMSITGRSAVPEAPRSTTPSSVTSSSSRTKSPATPVTRSLGRITRQGEMNRRTRRTSAQTDISLHSGSDSDASESETESESLRTRSASAKGEEPEARTVRRKKTLTPKAEKRKEDDDTEKEDEIERPKRTRRPRKAAEEKSAEESDDDTNPPKGRDFDLNQIRSELKGFTKAVKLNSAESSEKEIASSDDSNNVPDAKPPEEEIEVKKEIIMIEDKSSSDDIYEFKEPEPFEFESRSKLVDDKNVKKRLVPRIFEDVEKSPKKKTARSPGKPDSAEKRAKRTPPGRKTDESEDEERKAEDPFDKLVESPSFRIVKSAAEKKGVKSAVKTLNLDEPLSLFKEIEEAVEEVCDERLDISDNEGQPLFTHGEDIFSESTFAKATSEITTLDRDCVGFKDDRKKDSDDDDLIRASIQRVIERNLTDDDSDAAPDSPTVKKIDVEFAIASASLADEAPAATVPDAPPAVKQISPALQETDSSLLEAICAQQELIAAKLEETIELNVKTGPKIADSILQKFNMIKNKSENKATEEAETEVKQETEDVKKVVDVKVKQKVEAKTKPAEAKAVAETKPKETPAPSSTVVVVAAAAADQRKRPSRKAISREFVDSDTDSTDSEHLIIARSDEDSSQTAPLSFKSPKAEPTDDESQEEKVVEEKSSFKIQEERRNNPKLQEEQEKKFKFEDEKASDEVFKCEEEEEEESCLIKPKEEKRNFKFDDDKIETDCVKDSKDSHLHSLLLCNETIPGSPPVPVPEAESRPKSGKSSVLEMPFASAPGSSNSKSGLGNPGGAKEKPAQVQQERQPFGGAVGDNGRDGGREVNTVLDNTPPTTPESTISNLSPRGENGGLSPNTADNESCKSTEAECDYGRQRTNSTNKLSPYSEEDTLLNSEPSNTNEKKNTIAAGCKKRRRSCKTSDEVPVKRGRKPNNRSRHNSDSDDTSEEHSAQGSTMISQSSYDRISRSPRPSKYNFFVDLDPGLDSGQRIAVLQQKLSELRKTYADVKAELATIERRRKKIRRREREALKAAKQEVVCT